MKKKKEIGLTFLLLLIGITAGLVQYTPPICEENTAVYALSYSGGFTADGFLGTMLRILNLLPFELFHYEGVFRLTWILTASYFAVLVAFLRLTRDPADEKNGAADAVVSGIFVLSAVSFAMAGDGFGAPLVYTTGLTLIAVMLLVTDRFEWLLLPITVLCVLIKWNYIFYGFILLPAVLLLKGKQEKKRILLLCGVCIALTILSAAAGKTDAAAAAGFLSAGVERAAGPVEEILQTVNLYVVCLSAFLLSAAALKNAAVIKLRDRCLAALRENPVATVLAFAAILLISGLRG